MTAEVGHGGEVTLLGLFILAGNLFHFFYLQKFKVQRLEKEDEEIKNEGKLIRAELKSSTASISNLAMQIKVAVTRQNVMNRMNAQTLAGLMKRLEDLEDEVRHKDG